MNAARRKQIAAIVERLEGLKETMMAAMEEITEVKDAEQEAFDNLPESLQDGDRGQTMQAAIDALDTAHSDLDSIDLDAITNSLEEAKGE